MNSPMTPGTTTTGLTSADIFRNTVKRSLNDYTVKLKEDKYWSSYNQALTATANTHGLSNVLNPNYSPTTFDEADLFKAHCAFMYSVFVNTLHTLKSKKAIRQHEATQDGQAVYTALLKEYTKGIFADVTIENLESEIMGMRLDDKWNRSFTSYLDKWEHKIIDLEKIQGFSVPDDKKRKWITATLRTCNMLHTAITNARTIEHTMSSMNPSGTTNT